MVNEGKDGGETARGIRIATPKRIFWGFGFGPYHRQKKRCLNSICWHSLFKGESRRGLVILETVIFWYNLNVIFIAGSYRGPFAVILFAERLYVPDSN